MYFFLCSKMPSIVTQIEVLEKEVNENEERLDIIDRTFRLQKITDEEWENLSQEEASLKKQIQEQNKQLKSLRYENFKSMIVSCIILATIFGLYCLFWGL